VVTVGPLDKLEEVPKRETTGNHIIGQEIRDAKDDKFMELRYPAARITFVPARAHAMWNRWLCSGR